MFSWERKLIDFIKANRLVFFLGITTFLGLYVRYLALDFKSGDFVAWLEPWYKEINEAATFNKLNHQVGDYNIPYQTLIAFLGYLPIRPLYAYKIISIIFDFIMALVSARIGYVLSGQSKKKAAIIYSLVWLSVLVIMNSSMWAQCDSIYCSFILLSLLSFFEKKDLKCFIFLGIAFAFKLQTIFILPLYCVLYMAKKRFSILNFLCIPVMMVLLSIVGLMENRSIADVFKVYTSQVTSYNFTIMNVGSFWGLFNPSFRKAENDYIALLGIMLTLFVLLMIIFYWIRNIKLSEVDGKNILYMAYIIGMSCYIFLPNMHDRYAYVFEIIGLILIVLDKQMTLCVAMFQSVIFVFYIFFLYDYEKVDFKVLVLITLVSYILSLIHVNKSLKKA